MALRLLATAAAGLALSWAVPARAGAEPQRAYIVVYAGSVAQPHAGTREREQRLGFRSRFRYSRALKGFAARLTERQVDALRADPGVAMVAPDRPVKALAVPVAAGETVPPGIRRVGVVDANGARGPSGAAVAVLDTGIDLTHPQLNVKGGISCMGGSADDDHGHGTHVAGTIAARNDGAGVLGLAPGTPLYAVKVLDLNGSGTTSSVICGIDWVTRNASALGIKVANMSLGGAGPLGTCTAEPERAAICQSTAAGVTYVVAAGNDGSPLGTDTGQVPAIYPEVLTVSATSDSDGIPGGTGQACGPSADDSSAAFSNWAVTAATRAHMIAAPGACVLSTARGGGLTTMSGTSMATPHVAGLAALCMDEDGVPGPCAGLAPSQVIQVLRAAAAGHATLANGFAGDPLRPMGSAYYGHLAWGGPAPRAQTGEPASVQQRGATLAGTVDANGTDARWWIEYGRTTLYGQRTADQDIVGGGAQPVTADVSGLLPGTAYHYRVVVADEAWTVPGGDRVLTTLGDPPPETRIDARPAALLNAHSVRIEFSATGGPALGFECRVDSADWAGCTSPVDLPVPDERPYGFEVRAIGTDAVPDPTPATTRWRIDRTPPDTVIASGPANPSEGGSPAFRLQSAEASVVFACRLDGGAWSPCGSQAGYNGLTPGDHVFEARATDAAGNTDTTPALYAWHVAGAVTVLPAEAPQLAPDLPAAPALPQPGVLVRLSKPTTLRGRRVEVRLACRGDSTCTGVAQLRSKAVRGGRAAGRILGTKLVEIPAGRTARVRVRFGRDAEKRRLTAFVVLQTGGASHDLGRAVLRMRPATQKR